MSGKMKKVFAALIAPAALPTLFFVGKMIFFDTSNQNYLRDTAFETAAGILPFSYLLSFIVGLPILFALVRLRRLTMLSLTLSGAAGGLLSAALIYAFTQSLDGLAGSGYLFAFAAMAGSIVSAFFSVLADIRRSANR
jgi:hypothetical protein